MAKPAITVLETPAQLTPRGTSWIFRAAIVACAIRQKMPLVIY